MAARDARAMGQSLKHLLTKESVEAFAGMTKQEARYLTRAVESLAKETGDYVSDHLFATLRHQFEKGTSRTKAVKFAKNLFHKREAVGRMYDYLDDAARAALYELAEAEDVLQEEIEQLGKIAQTYQAEAGKALTKPQLDDLLGDSTLGEKSVEEVVAGLVKAAKRTYVASADKITPSMPKGSKPFGNYADEINDSIKLQNETADLFASEGYHVEMLDTVEGGNGFGIKKEKNPDYLIEEKVFDCYAPDKDVKIKNIITKMRKKTQEQASNIVLNLERYEGDMEELLAVIKRKANAEGDLKHLQELWIVKDNKLIYAFD